MMFTGFLSRLMFCLTRGESHLVELPFRQLLDFAPDTVCVEISAVLGDPNGIIGKRRSDHAELDVIHCPVLLQMQFEKPLMESVCSDSRGVKSDGTKVVRSIVAGV